METLCEYCFNEEHLKEAANELIQLFQKYIVDPDINVRIIFKELFN